MSTPSPGCRRQDDPLAERTAQAPPGRERRGPRPRARPVPARSLLRVPRQLRAVETVHAILDAAMRVAEEGAAFTADRVAQAAGIGPGSLYEYFANRDMILVGIVERAALEATALVRRGLEAHRGGTLDEQVRAGLEALASALEPYGPLLSALQHETPPLVRERAADLEGLLRSVVRDWAPPGIEQRPAHAGGAALYVALNGTLFVMLKWYAERPPEISREQLLEALAAMIRGLAAPGPAGGPAQPPP